MRRPPRARLARSSRPSTTRIGDRVHPRTAAPAASASSAVAAAPCCSRALCWARTGTQRANRAGPRSSRSATPSRSAASVAKPTEAWAVSPLRMASSASSVRPSASVSVATAVDRAPPRHRRWPPRRPRRAPRRDADERLQPPGSVHPGRAEDRDQQGGGDHGGQAVRVGEVEPEGGLQQERAGDGRQWQLEPHRTEPRHPPRPPRRARRTGG